MPTRRAPISPTPQPLPERRLNYIRNAVKVVIDAYHGTVDFYLVDPQTRSPRPTSACSQGSSSRLRPCRRSCKRIFATRRISSSSKRTCIRRTHMDTPEVFITAKISGSSPASSGRGHGHDGPILYHHALPGETEAEFFLMLPMVPSKRDNMIAWLAARCDLPNYGKLIVYEFPKEKLVYGPFQIEARINQNTEISQQISFGIRWAPGSFEATCW